MSISGLFITEENKPVSSQQVQKSAVISTENLDKMDPVLLEKLKSNVAPMPITNDVELDAAIKKASDDFKAGKGSLSGRQITAINSGKAEADLEGFYVKNKDKESEEVVSEAAETSEEEELDFDEEPGFWDTAWDKTKSAGSATWDGIKYVGTKIGAGASLLESGIDTAFGPVNNFASSAGLTPSAVANIIQDPLNGGISHGPRAIGNVYDKAGETGSLSLFTLPNTGSEVYTRDTVPAFDLNAEKCLMAAPQTSGSISQAKTIFGYNVKNASTGEMERVPGYSGMDLAKHTTTIATSKTNTPMPELANANSINAFSGDGSKLSSLGVVDRRTEQMSASVMSVAAKNNA